MKTTKTGIGPGDYVKYVDPYYGLDYNLKKDAVYKVKKIMGYYLEVEDYSYDEKHNKWNIERFIKVNHYNTKLGRILYK